ncbi:hypothetical protein Bpfe_011856 [Biomphalaria pfeifferi]|uniref:Uncharacterized protein n=1 Tax=Biomphalaria pfeifferi TaxID=112525 RepID=A0AAD8BQU8_BIOPF|nr:hypothetical protein Bpfe_011856 [Biomphalaria pfeifferi]
MMVAKAKEENVTIAEQRKKNQDIHLEQIGEFNIQIVNEHHQYDRYGYTSDDETDDTSSSTDTTESISSSSDEPRKKAESDEAPPSSTNSLESQENGNCLMM